MKETIQMKEVFTISEGKENTTRWTKIGVAFVNRDDSINVILDALPVSGRLHIRDRAKEEKKDK